VAGLAYHLKNIKTLINHDDSIANPKLKLIYLARGHENKTTATKKSFFNFSYSLLTKISYINQEHSLLYKVKL